MTILKLTQIPSFNSVVIKQEQGHFFISTPNSIIIDKVGWIRLTEELVKIGFISAEDLSELSARIGIGYEDKENTGDIS